MALPHDSAPFLEWIEPMPTYDYECQKCGHRYEVFQSMKDARFTDCPLETCDGAVKRLLGTGAGIIFKGSGFYETDYRSDSYKKAASAGRKPQRADRRLRVGLYAFEERIGGDKDKGK